MQFRSRFFDLLFNLAQSKTVSPTLIPIDFIVDDMKVEPLSAAIWSRSRRTGTLCLSMISLPNAHGRWKNDHSRREKR